MDHLKVLQSKGILKNADSYTLTNREKRELIDAFQNLSKINKIDLPKKANFNPHTIGLISKNLTLKEMINLSLTNKKMREIMTPIIENKRNSLEELRDWLNGLPNPRYYTIENLDQMKILHLNNNHLTKLPSLNLPNLKELDLTDNELTEIPTLSLPNLKYLWLNNNQLKFIPNFNLPNLKELFLYDNNLTEFPNINLPNITLLDLEENLLPETEKNRLKSIYGHKVIL